MIKDFILFIDDFCPLFPSRFFSLSMKSICPLCEEGALRCQKPISEESIIKVLSFSCVRKSRNKKTVLRQEMEKLAHMPGRVHLTPEEPWHSEGVHRLPVKNFYVYFWIDEDRKKVQVTDVIYMKRDQQRQLMNMPMDEK